MSSELFWHYQDYASSKALGIGFSLFSLPHVLWLACIAAGIAVFTAAYCWGGERRRDNLRKSMALFLILFEIFKQCACPFTCVPNGMFLPLEICSFAEYAILADALWPRNRFLGLPLALVFLPAAFMALMAPTCTVYPPISFYAIHQFILHAGIIAYIVARYAADEIRFRYVGVWKSLLFVAVMITPIYVLDLTLQRNHMFLVFHENNPVLRLVWDLTGGSGGFPYLAGLTVLVTVVMHAAFAVLVLVKRIPRRK